MNDLPTSVPCEILSLPHTHLLPGQPRYTSRINRPAFSLNILSNQGSPIPTCQVCGGLSYILCRVNKTTHCSLYYLEQRRLYPLYYANLLGYKGMDL